MKVTEYCRLKNPRIYQHKTNVYLFILINLIDLKKASEQAPFCHTGVLSKMVVLKVLRKQFFLLPSVLNHFQKRFGKIFSKAKMIARLVQNLIVETAK